MKFAQPIWLYATLLVVPLLVWMFRHFHHRRSEALRQFTSSHLVGSLTANVSPGRRKVKRWLLLTAVALAMLTLARPQYGFRWEEAKRKGIDILFAVDTSRSMLAEDVKPNRLSRAKMAVSDLVSKLEGDRVGLIAFAGGSFLQCPLTLDYDAFRQSLDALDTTIIPTGGTDLARAIQEAETSFGENSKSHKILVLITDGEDLEAKGKEAARAAASRGMKIFTVGVGSAAGELIPIRNESGGVDFLKNEEGKPVRSKLDDATLRQIAEVSGGFYEPLGQQGQGLEAIYDRGLAAIPKQELASKMNKIYIDRFQWTLMLVILLLAMEMMMGDRKLEKRITFLLKRRSRASTLKAIVGMTGFLILMGSTTSHASPQSAERAYKKGQYTAAAQEYRKAAEKSPDNAKLQYNLGAAHYKEKKWNEAASAFQKALKTSETAFQENVFYNLGNSQYRMGQQTEKDKPEQTIQTWKQALQSYENALQLKADDGDAKFNYDFVKKKLEELEKKQEQEKKEHQDQKSQNKQDEKNSKQNQSNDSKDSKNSSGNQDKNDQSQEGKDSKESAQNHPADQKDSSKTDSEKSEKGPQNEKHSSQKEQGNSGKSGEPNEKGNEKEVPPLPGQMTKEEAKNLLDSLKGDEKKMPTKLTPSGSLGSGEDHPKKDW